MAKNAKAGTSASRENVGVNLAKHIWRELDAPRAPSKSEHRVLTALANAVGEPLLDDQVSSVVVDAVCRCGCSSVRLRSDRQAVPAETVTRLSGTARADYLTVEAFGCEPDHQAVNVVLHVIGGRVGELEVFDAVKGEGAAVVLDQLLRLTKPTVS